MGILSCNPISTWASTTLSSRVNSGSIGLNQGFIDTTWLYQVWAQQCNLTFISSKHVESKVETVMQCVECYDRAVCQVHGSDKKRVTGVGGGGALQREFERKRDT